MAHLPRMALTSEVPQSSVEASHHLPSDAAAAAAASATPTYTAEQRSAAIAMKKLTNHYDRLGIQRTATEVEIKSAYRRKAMLFHPDKNSAVSRSGSHSGSRS